MSDEQATPRRIRVIVDHDVCVGSGMCWGGAPGVFVSGHDSQAEVIVGETDETPEILEAIEMCPTGAISIARVDS